jgi:AcrR family transcriptional regulator
LARPRTVSRDLILEASARLFDASGYQGTRVEDISESVNLNKASLYYYFANKADILYTILSDTTDRFLAMIAEIPLAAAPREALALVITFHLDELVGRPHEAGIYFRELPWLNKWLPSEQFEMIRKKENLYLAHLTTIIQRGIDDGTFVAIDARVAAFGLLGMNAWAFNWYRNNGRTSSPRDVADVFTTLFLDGLVKRDAMN